MMPVIKNCNSHKIKLMYFSGTIKRHCHIRDHCSIPNSCFLVKNGKNPVLGHLYGQKTLNCLRFRTINIKSYLVYC